MLLLQILQRLNDEVGGDYKMLDEHRTKSVREIGFWTSIRIIMPIIEAVAHVTGEKTQEFIGKHLDIETPYLMWDLFRHPLIHGDLLHHAKYKNKEVSWGVMLGNISSKHLIAKGNIMIDPRYLYKKLKEYLEKEIANNDQVIINVEVGVLYQTPKQEIITEFLKL